MDVLPRVSRQLMELLREMSPVQRALSIAMSVVVLFGFGWIVVQNQGSDLQPVSFGKQFSAEELTSAEQALSRAGLFGFRREGQRLLAPAKDLDRCNAALLEFDALPADLGSQMLKQYETLGPFSTDRQRQQMKEALLLQELRRMIKGVAEIEDARVAVASPERKQGWNQKSRVTANVTVKPRPGREISRTLVESLRQVVASMVPDLQSADVTVFDVTRGQAYSGESTESPTESLYLKRAREFSRQYEQQIQKALSYVPQVSVVVQVDLEALKSTIERNANVKSRNEFAQVANRPGSVSDGDQISANSYLTGFRGSSEVASPQEPRNVSESAETPQAIVWADRPTRTSQLEKSFQSETPLEEQLNAAIPKAVQVSVAIPRDYIREIVERRNARRERSSIRLDPGTVEEEVVSKVEHIVGRLIPADSPSRAISVTCVDRLSSETPLKAPLVSQESISRLVRTWGIPIAIGLTLLAFVGMFWRRSPGPSSGPVHTIEYQPESQPEQTTPTLAALIPIHQPLNVPDRLTVLRDEIRNLVATDPAASATLMSQWLLEVES